MRHPTSILAMFVAAAASILTISLNPGEAHGQQVGDTVVVVRTASLKSGETILGEVRRTMALKIEHVNGDWIWVTRGVSGWLHRRHVVPVPEAISFLTAQIRTNPNNPVSYNDRATVYFETGQLDNAIADYTAALRLNSSYDAVYSNRAIAWFNKGEHEKAIADLSEVIKLKPEEAEPYADRGWVYHQIGDYEKALADYELALKQDAQSITANSNIAWLRATCPDENYRDATAALEAATIACEASDHKSGFAVNCLAAAHAEAGDFEKAVEHQTKAVKLAANQVKDAYKERLALYKDKKPHREKSIAEAAETDSDETEPKEDAPQP